MDFPTQILIDANFFEHLLNCMASQKFLYERGGDFQNSNEQKIMDEAYHKARKILHEDNKFKISYVKCIKN